MHRDDPVDDPVVPAHEVVVAVNRFRRDGGVERYTWEVASSLAGAGHRVSVLAGREGHDGNAPTGVVRIPVGRSAPLNTWRGGLASISFPLLARARIALHHRRAVPYGPVGSLLP